MHFENKFQFLKYLESIDKDPEQENPKARNMRNFVGPWFASFHTFGEAFLVIKLLDMYGFNLPESVTWVTDVFGSGKLDHRRTEYLAYGRQFDRDMLSDFSNSSIKE
ncbi:hypothetical protein BS50DRAFT_587000 [Corynespora cassiicola Philippines]|uniref:Uncharacterized protein n=1 Tax=Corynespora cassiicola Philippines TaxID=1448308 RepID=A0A2T2NQR0_CORCC|nr:hypothetical protein BS50DRAFT_587000 [Corynespora cassiicola Philippines]